ncbi:MAG: signal peptide peptidase SppA [Allosphingosinicella sp.]|uniref:signal peptide peptidase SppA n=1 Tax=Allosphingosinicella sp. TaxID=2823234 RepID=UPI003959674A
MRVLGKVWKLLVGVKDALVLIFMLLFFGALYAGLSASPYSGSATRGALHLDLGGTIVEQPVEESPLALMGGGSVTREFRLRDVVHALDTAAADSRIQAVALDLDVFTGGGQAALANVADAIARVKAADKPVIAFATGYSDAGYMLASHASEVWLDPLGGVVLTGRGGSGLYYAGLLERIGVTANVYRVGTYKAAVEPFTRSDMSPEAREANQALADSLWEAWLEKVRRARPQADLLPYVADTAGRIEAANGDLAQAALAARLVDRIGSREEFGTRVAELAGTDTPAIPGSFRAVSLDAWTAWNPAGHRGGQIGVVTVAGDIVDGSAALGTAGAETVVENIERGLKDHSLSALVVRVDSPGGSVTASERIRRAVLAAKAKGLPVVVSFGSVAASGGYWIATAGDHIMAEPSTITGSIGVFGILPSFEGTLERLGIGADGVKTTPLSGEPDLLRGPSPEADRLIQAGVDSTYRRFLNLVAEARRLPPQRVDEIAQGRVWAGGTARQIGLVDQFGSLQDAVAEAARRAEIDPERARVVYLEPEPTVLARILRRAASGSEAPPSPDVFSRAFGRPEALVAQALTDAEAILRGPVLQARCLECPVQPRAAAASPTRLQRLLAWLG